MKTSPALTPGAVSRWTVFSSRPWLSSEPRHRLSTTVRFLSIFSDETGFGYAEDAPLENVPTRHQSDLAGVWREIFTLVS